VFSVLFFSSGAPIQAYRKIMANKTRLSRNCPSGVAQFSQLY